MAIVPINDLIDYVNDNIKTNGVRAITGAIHNTALIDTIDTLWNEIQNIPTGSGHVIQDEGVTFPNRGNLNFVGDDVTVSDDSGNDATVVTVAGNGHYIQDTGTPVIQRGNLNFVGATVSDDSGNDATVITIAATGGGHTIQDDGTPVTQRTNLNFKGNLVTVSDDSGNDATDLDFDYTTNEIVPTAALSTFTISGDTTFNLSAVNKANKVIEVSMDQAFDGDLTFTGGVKGTNYVVRLTTASTAFSPSISLAASTKVRSASALIAPNSSTWVHDFNVSFDGVNYWVSPDYDQN